MNNSIFTIQPYLLGGTQWVFDDETVGLVKEAFVAGADTLLDRMANGKKKVTVLFSSSEFKGYDLKLDLTDTSPMGSDYFCKQLAHELWLCPALGHYFKIPPKNLYIKIK